VARDCPDRRRVSRAEAARQAITETAEPERRRAGPAAEAAELMKNPAYVREARRRRGAHGAASWFAVTCTRSRWRVVADMFSTAAALQ
jgi:hypothetical protein